ncbi:MAG: YlxR family protein [Candidatus Adiutrix sp.]|nr:YlxR family protein [Candidatus Adiutrix sp.]
MTAGRAEPRRTCLGCRSVRAQADLRRLALAPGPEGPRVVWDDQRALGGRGAWVCRERPECLSLAIKRRSLGRAFKLGAAPDLSGLTAGRRST